MTAGRRAGRAALQVVLVAAVAFMVVLPPALRRGWDHDEHQFVAAGALLATENKLPYRDYPYHHMPNLVFVYGALYSITDHRLLPARACSVAASALVLALLVRVALTALAPLGRTWASVLGVAAVALLVTTPIFRHTSGRTWNHELPTLLTVTALVLYVAAADRRRPARWLLGSGLLLALAAGTRVTFLLVLVPFVLALPFHPAARALTCRRLAASFGAGVAIGFLPVLAVLALASDGFVHGIVRYPRLSTLEKLQSGYQLTMTLPGKLSYLGHTLRDRAMLSLVLAFLIAVPWRALLGWPLRGRWTFATAMTVLALAFLFAGSLAPTPVFPQYLFAPMPFLALGTLLGLAAHAAQGARGTGARATAVTVLAGVAGFHGGGHYLDARTLIRPVDWFPTQVRSVGALIRERAGAGPVLTLAPVYPLEAGMPIYEALATGPFAWRSGHLVPEGRRRELGIVTSRELPALVASRPPAAVLSGFEGVLETPLVEYARGRGFRETALPGHGVLWLPQDPATVPDEASRRR